jgi:hypothetical protein
LVVERVRCGLIDHILSFWSVDTLNKIPSIGSSCSCSSSVNLSPSLTKDLELMKSISIWQ